MNRCASKFKIQCHLQLITQKKREIQNIYAKNNKIMLKEIKDLNRWRHRVFMDWKVQHN